MGGAGDGASAFDIILIDEGVLRIEGCGIVCVVDLSGIHVVISAVDVSFTTDECNTVVV